MKARFVTVGDPVWNAPVRRKVAISRSSRDMPGYEVDITTLTLEEAEGVCKALIRLLMQKEVKK